MSASLVGSEMCIRDRAGPTRTGRRSAMRRSPGQPSDQSPSNRRGPTTVSYTHLTLPTICSV
eukprot:14855246-Alexandrium_andersonii.AAC.1